MKKILLIFIGIVMILQSCDSAAEEQPKQTEESFEWQIDQFADVRVLRYQLPGFDSLSLREKKLVYYLHRAGLAGRDILFDQNYKYNLLVKRTLETLYIQQKEASTGEEWLQFEAYLKRVWFSNGIHHHYSADKFFPECSREYMESLIQATNAEKLPLLQNQTKEEYTHFVLDIIYNKDIAPKRINQAEGEDIVTSSACNFYEGVTHDEVKEFYDAITANEDDTPPMIGLNSKLVKQNGKVVEQVYRLNGMYSAAIEQIIHWLDKAKTVAENKTQEEVISLLIEYYKTGDLETFDTFCIKWVEDTSSNIDFINGFIENYGDPMGRKATWESVVQIKNIEATKRTEILSTNAQWFEDNSPVDEKFKKDSVKGVTARVIDVAGLGGDCYPATPIGINLPNSLWIREQHGSKSVTINNIMYAYDKVSQGTGYMEEFAWDDAEIQRAKTYGFNSFNVHVDLHECLGHGSGKNLDGVNKDALGKYYNTIEETRADLFALYYGYDQKLVDLGLIPHLDAGKAEYDSYIKGGLMTQLRRIELGNNLEEAHMRNRQLIAKWVYEKGEADSVIVRKQRDGKTFFVIEDYEQLKVLFGDLLAEIQRIKSTGDYTAAMELVEGYAVKIDKDIHKEVLERFEALNLPSYSGFVNPEYEVIMNNDTISDITIRSANNYIEQMLQYSEENSFLPILN